MTPVHTVQALALPCMASVSQCRAAVRRWGAGAAFALKMLADGDTRHQTKGMPAPLRTLLERFVPTAPSANAGTPRRNTAPMRYVRAVCVSGLRRCPAVF